LLAEETLLLQTDFSDIDLTLAYSEKNGGLEFTCEASGVPVNPLEEGAHEDDIGIKLIRSRSTSSHYRYDNGKNIVSIQVKEN
jgi:polar amino acid transport system ATP-binding protein